MAQATPQQDEFTFDDTGCPKCGGSMRRVNTRSGEAFYGCNSFPRCRGSRNIDGTTPEPYHPPTLRVPTGGAPKPYAAPTGVVGSPEQNAIWKAISEGSDHVVVKALAGAGKSFTCRHAMGILPRHLKVLYLAFNKSIVQEFREGAPPNAEVTTLNAKGYRVVKNAFPGALVDADKVANIISELVDPRTQQDLDSLRSLTTTVEKLVSMAQGYVIDGRDQEALLDIAERHDIAMDDDTREQALALVPEVLRLSRERCNVISFNDQLWLPVVLKLAAPKYDVIYVDEAQDLNRVQHLLVMQLLAPNGRVVIVGDDHQAIYGFRGSDVDSINNFCALLEKTGKAVQQLPLTVTRRCPKKVVAYAQQWVPSLEALPDAPDGTIVVTDTDKAEALYQPGDMVLCRCNAPLTSVAFRLIQRGIKAVIRGRDIGQGLITLIKKLRPRDINDLQIKLDKWAAVEIGKVAGTRREESVTQSIRDRADCILALCEACDSVTELCARITSIFDNFDANDQPRAAVVMSSIHRAKGLEAANVFWLQPDLSCKCTQDWQERQEENLRYVAATRAKSQLVLVYKKGT